MGKRTIVLTPALTLSILLLTSFTYAQLNGTLQVSFIDVRQGDSILMSTSGDTYVLVDAGQSWAGPTVVAYV